MLKRTKKMQGDNHGHVHSAGLMIWDEPLRNVVREILHLVGIEDVSSLPTSFPAAISSDFLNSFSTVDIVLIEAFNTNKNIRDAEGFRLAKILASAPGVRCRFIVLFRSMPEELRKYNCFIDFATFDIIRDKMKGLLEEDISSAPYVRAEGIWPELAKVPIHH